MMITMILAMLSTPPAAPRTMVFTSHAIKATHKRDAGDRPEVFTASEKAPAPVAKRL